MRCEYCGAKLEEVQFEFEIRYFCPKGCTENRIREDFETRFPERDSTMKQNPEAFERNVLY